jgi:hypothetical protein
MMHSCHSCHRLLNRDSRVSIYLYLLGLGELTDFRSACYERTAPSWRQVQTRTPISRCDDNNDKNTRQSQREQPRGRANLLSSLATISRIHGFHVDNRPQNGANTHHDKKEDHD